MRRALAVVFRKVHWKAEAESVACRRRGVAFSYVTSVSFVDFIRSFARVFSVRCRELDSLIFKLRVRFSGCQVYCNSTPVCVPLFVCCTRSMSCPALTLACVCLLPACAGSCVCACVPQSGLRSVESARENVDAMQLEVAALEPKLLQAVRTHPRGLCSPHTRLSWF